MLSEFERMQKGNAGAADEFEEEDLLPRESLVSEPEPRS
jgi:hypothetical protein